MANSNIDYTTQYSLSSLLDNLLRVNQNSLEIMNKLSNITTTDSDVVEVDVIDSNNQISKVFVPSYGQIKADINRLNANVKQLAGVGESNANVQLEDGSFRKLILSNLQLEGKTIKNISSPTTFETKTNWFFEQFLNPLLYISFDFTGQIPSETERCKVQRFILNLSNTSQQNIWKNLISGKSNLDYVDFFQLLLKHNISYFLDEDIIDTPPRDLRFYGNFTVLRVFDDVVNELVDGATFTKRLFKIQLNTMNYNDSTSEYKKTQQLKIGDTFIITKADKAATTRYQITNIDLDDGNIIEIKLLEGHDLLSIGTELEFYNQESIATTLDVNVGFNEYTVVFVKAINPVSKIPAINWSPGVAFYTNSLEITDAAGRQVTLEEYYKEKVVDFGTYLYNMAKDGIPPATLGETPNVPNVQSTDFVVSQINNHITDVSRIDKIKGLQTEKTTIQSKLDSLNNSIKTKRANMNTKRYTSQSQRDTDQSELNELINNSSSSSILLKSAVDEIIALADSDNLEGITPKFRVKGFWPIPDPMPSLRTAPQEVVQFIVQYRYVTKDGGANQPEQITFTDNNGTERRGTFSPWTELVTPVRKRIKDTTTGQYSWVNEEIENADAVNINQLEIAIKQGEGVEIKIKSLSEAGWPTNPAESAFSGIARVDFPDELVSSNEVSKIVEQARLTSEALEITTALADSGVTQHISEQFTQNETFYAHTANGIASGFLTDEQNVINLFEKMSNFEVRITSIEEALTGEKGKLSVQLIDPGGRNFRVKNNSLVKLFGGNYIDLVKDLTVKKGVIISKTYLLQLANANATPLELYSREFGNYTKVVNASFVNGVGFDSNEVDYNTSRRYDATPLGPSNLSPNDVLSYQQFIDLPYQTGQVKGQYINTRYSSVDGTSNLYEDVDTTTGIPSATLPLDTINLFPDPTLSTPLTDYTEHEYNLSNAYPLPGSGTVAGDFIWSGVTGGGVAQTVGTSTIANWNNGIYVHVDHPSIGAWGTVPGAPVIGPSGLGAAGPTGVRNSGFAPLISTDITSGSQKQASYHYFTLGGVTGPTAKSAHVSKMGFEAYDQYLLGPNSCGSYLFLSPLNNTGSINVDGANQLSTSTLNFGIPFASNIPLIFQYRMTDYFGATSSGLGNVGGDTSGTTNQLEYTKRIGIDIYSNIDERFSFDVEITARYRSASLQFEEVPTTSLEAVVDDLTRTVRILNPQVSGIKQESSTGSGNSGGLLGSIQ